MISRGIATFTLDYGTAPRWLFERMVKLGREIIYVIVDEFGSDELVKRLSDPVWFQSLGTVLAFDWNASGLTTILTAALKEAVRGQEKFLGIFICGGKGKTSRKTPEEINFWGERLSLPAPSIHNLIYSSKMAAKVDSSLVQDGYQIYHHAFIFSKTGHWTVIQQGMNTQNQTARRYHWYSDNIKEIVVEPHTGIASQKKSTTLDLTAKKSEKTREISIKLVNQNFSSLLKDIKILRKYSSSLSKMIKIKVERQNFASLPLKNKTNQLTLLELSPAEFHFHPVALESFLNNRYLEKILAKLCFEKPKSYEKLLATEGVGPKTIRALSLVAEVIYGAKPSYEDPARYSFAHGGKDGTPYPVDKKTYDRTIEFFKRVINKTKLSVFEKKRLIIKLHF